MPGFDGTGPGGMGPMTGGGRGPCNPYNVPYAGPYPNPMTKGPTLAYRRGRPRWGLRGLRGRGMGWEGRGRRRWW